MFLEIFDMSGAWKSGEVRASFTCWVKELQKSCVVTFKCFMRSVRVFWFSQCVFLPLVCAREPPGAGVGAGVGVGAGDHGGHVNTFLTDVVTKEDRRCTKSSISDNSLAASTNEVTAISLTRAYERLAC